MNPMKCEYCGTETLKVDGNVLICAQCGAPLKNVYALEVAPVYVVKCDHALTPEAKARLRDEFKKIFTGGNAPAVAILDRGLDIQALK